MLLELCPEFPSPHALSAFADCTNPGVVIIAVAPRVIVTITPIMSIPCIMRKCKRVVI